jgi:hypothetical protein
LTLPRLIGVPLSMGGTSQRAMLDNFFGSLDGRRDWRRGGCGPEVPERQMPFEALDKLGPAYLLVLVLVLDRGYPAAWLLACLQQRGIRFCTRGDKVDVSPISGHF